MSWGLFVTFARDQWKGMLAGALICALVMGLRKNGAETAAQSVITAHQAQQGEVKAQGTVRIAGIPARAAVPCPPQGVCPACPEQPAVDIAFGSSAQGGQQQGVTASAKAEAKGHGLAVAVGGGVLLGPYDPLLGVLVSYGDYGAYYQRSLGGVQAVGGYWTALRY